MGGVQERELTGSMSHDSFLLLPRGFMSEAPAILWRKLVLLEPRSGCLFPFSPALSVGMP